MDFLKQDLVYHGAQQVYAIFSSISTSSTSQSPPFVNSGFRGKAIAYLKAEEALCSPVDIQLNNGDTDIITTPGYPTSYSVNLNCEWTITAPGRIRLVFNDFHAMLNDSLTVYDASGNVYGQKPFNGWQTWDETFALYLDNKVKLVFQSVTAVVTVPGLYITINAFPIIGSPQSCPSSGEYDLIVLGDTGVTISTPGFGTNAYPNNLYCEWTLRNSKKNSVIVTQLWMETEHCCDILEVRDMINTTLKYRGKEANINSLSNAPMLLMNFSSDGALASTGFQVIAKAVDCACDSMKEIHLTATSNSESITSPGYSTGFGYCNNLLCGWSISAPPGSFIRISVSTLQIRVNYQGPKNLLLIQDRFGQTIANYTSKSNSNTPQTEILVAGHIANITFLSDAYFPSDVVHRGFSLTATMVSSPAPNVHVSQTLTDASFALPIERLTNNINFMGVWSVRARSGRKVRFYNFAGVSSAQVVLLDGPDLTSSPIDSRTSSTTPFGKVTPVVSSGEFMTVVFLTSSTDGAVRFAALLSDYEDDIYEPRCGGFAFVHHSANSNNSAPVKLNAVNIDKCVSVLYAFKDTGTPTYTDAFKFNFENVSDSLSVFRGITTDPQYLIADSQSGSYPADVYGTFVTLQFSGNISLSFQFIALNFSQITMSTEGGVIMSPDYKAIGCPQLSQSFLWHGNEKGLVFNLETSLYSGTLVIARSLYSQTQDTITITSQNDKREVKFCATYALITYNSNTNNGSGFLASYRQSTEDLCKFACMWRSSIFVIILCICFAFLS